MIHILTPPLVDASTLSGQFSWWWYGFGLQAGIECTAWAIRMMRSVASSSDSGTPND